MPEPTEIDAAAPITITLQAGEWNQILSILSDAPYKLVAGVIAQMTTQASQQVRAIAQQQPSLPNGRDDRPTN